MISILTILDVSLMVVSYIMKTNEENAAVKWEKMTER